MYIKYDKNFKKSAKFFKMGIDNRTKPYYNLNAF